jgi:hypothetical protein
VPDDSWADAARIVPGGFGGMLVTDNVWTYYLVDTTQHEAAVRALIALGVSPAVDWAKTRTLPGRWDFAQMDDWFRYIGLRLGPASANVGSFDIDELRNRIQYSVFNRNGRRALEGVLATLDLPCYLVEIDSQPPTYALSKTPRRTR